MATYRDKGIVLKSAVMRGADRRYVVLTEGHGKIAVLAKGTRRGRSKMAPHMAHFGVVELMIARGRVMDRLAGANLLRSHAGITASLRKTAAAQSLLLAVDALTRTGLAEQRLFVLVDGFLSVLDGSTDAAGGRDPLFDAAVVKLLDILGVAPEVGVCVGCRQPLVPRGNAVNFLRGGIECAGCSGPAALPVSDGAIKTLRFFRAEPLAAVPALRFAPAVRREVSDLVDLLLDSHLEDRIPALRYLQSLA